MLNSKPNLWKDYKGILIMPDEELINGAYYADCAVGEAAECAKNKEDAKKLFDYCNEATKASQ